MPKSALFQSGIHGKQREVTAMAYYRECPTCGAHLDPGERCTECADRAKERTTEKAGAGAERIRLERTHPLVRTTGTARRIQPNR